VSGLFEGRVTVQGEDVWAAGVDVSALPFLWTRVDGGTAVPDFEIPALRQPMSRCHCQNGWVCEAHLNLPPSMRTVALPAVSASGIGEHGSATTSAMVSATIVLLLGYRPIKVRRLPAYGPDTIATCAALCGMASILLRWDCAGRRLTLISRKGLPRVITLAAIVGKCESVSIENPFQTHKADTLTALAGRVLKHQPLRFRPH
jgi:hypothetical protein